MIDSTKEAKAKRVHELRKELGLSQEAFGKKLGVGKTAISKIEKGENNLSDSMITLISKIYNVNDYWLRDGCGDKLIAVPDSVIDELAIEYNLNEFWKETLQKFLNMNDEEKDAYEFYLKKLFNIK